MSDTYSYWCDKQEESWLAKNLKNEKVTSSRSTVKKYVKKPIPVEAIQWTGKNYDELDAFAGSNIFIEDGILKCKTLEGTMSAKNKYGDYVVKGPIGEFYICEKSVFEMTYEETK